jgi:hypothetical protein
MLLPFVGFVMGCVGFTILGLIVLASVPTLHLTARNLIIFVVGAFPGTLALGYVYGRLFADSKNELNSKAAVLGFFSVMLVGAIVGGTVLVRLGMHLFKPSDGH